jgi:hypothetical protein
MGKGKMGRRRENGYGKTWRIKMGTMVPLKSEAETAVIKIVGRSGSCLGGKGARGPE